MKLSTILRYQFGSRKAIEEVAQSKAAIWVGIILVVITTIPRNYDQTWISEEPFNWIFGPLLFSLFSGTWIYLMAYRPGTRWGIRKLGMKFEPRAEDWSCFMGLFWMTAPIAWLYAIPVEYWLGAEDAARANITLLSVVSLWRVALMARVLQVLTERSYLKTLTFVLFAASIEVLFVILIAALSGNSPSGIAEGMGGMRNSPAETITSRMLSFIFEKAIWVFLATLLPVLKWAWRGTARPLPKREGSLMDAPRAGLAAIAAIWIAVALPQQAKVARNAEIDRLVEQEDYVGAVALMSNYSPDQLAPSRQLPPKAYELSIFEELPPMLAAMNEQTPAWLQEHLLMSLGIMHSHLEQAIHSHDMILTYFRDDLRPETHVRMFEGIRKTDAGQAWLESNSGYLQWCADHANLRTQYASDSQSGADWVQLRAYIEDHFQIQPAEE